MWTPNKLEPIFVKRGTVTEWSQAEHRFVLLPLDGELEDPTLTNPIPIRALLDAASADNAVAAALYAKQTPWLMQREQETRDKFVRALLLTLEDRNLHPSAEQRAVIQACTDDERLAGWLRAAARVGSVAERLDA